MKHLIALLCISLVFSFSFSSHKSRLNDHETDWDSQENGLVPMADEDAQKPSSDLRRALQESSQDGDMQYERDTKAAKAIVTVDKDEEYIVKRSPFKKQRVEDDSHSHSHSSSHHNNGFSGAAHSSSSMSASQSSQSGSMNGVLQAVTSRKCTSEMTPAEELHAACSIVAGSVEGRSLPYALQIYITKFLKDEYCGTPLRVDGAFKSFSPVISNNGKHCAFGHSLIDLFNFSIRDFTVSGMKTDPSISAMPAGLQFMLSGYAGGKDNYPCLMDYVHNKCLILEPFNEGHFSSYPLGNARISQDRNLFSVYGMGRDAVIRKFTWNLKTGKPHGNSQEIIKLSFCIPSCISWEISEDEKWMAVRMYQSYSGFTGIGVIKIKSSKPGEIVAVSCPTDRSVLNLVGYERLPRGSYRSIQFRNNKLWIVGKKEIYEYDPETQKLELRKKLGDVHDERQQLRSPVFSPTTTAIAIPTQNSEDREFGKPRYVPGYTIEVAPKPGDVPRATIKHPEKTIVACAASPQGSVVVAQHEGIENGKVPLMIYHDMGAFLGSLVKRVNQLRENRERRRAESAKREEYLAHQVEFQKFLEHKKQQEAASKKKDGKLPAADKGDIKENGH